MTVALEYVDPIQIGCADANGALNPAILEAALMISDLALEPSKVRMVISGNFVQSVRDRLPTAEEAAMYSVARNGGTVGGKTMERADGTIDVILQAMLFGSDGGATEHVDRRRIALHTATHEGQHVLMKQAGEDSPDFAHLTRATGWCAGTAHEIINEFRAEAAVPKSLLGPSPEGWDCVGVAAHLIESLRQVDALYQDDLNLVALVQGVTSHVSAFWKILGVVATERRRPTGMIEPLPGDVVKDPAWEIVVDDNWDAMVAILEDIPSAVARVNADDLSAAQDKLAELLDTWLRDIGFRFEDSPDGTGFFIDHRNVLG